jgi:hypothetical protein
MNDDTRGSRRSDALVLFGITGDLAYGQSFRRQRDSIENAVREPVNFLR